MKHILYITYYWPPAGGPGVQRSVKFVKYLAEYGIRATVLTVDERQATYPVLDESLLAEVSPDTEVIRTSTYEPFGIYRKLIGAKSNSTQYQTFVNEASTSWKQKIAQFIRGNIFIPDPRRGWNLVALPTAIKLVKETSFDAVITSGPPHSTHLMGFILKEKYNLKWIADLRDPWTDIYFAHLLFQTPLAKWINAYYERQVLIKCDNALVVSSPIKELFENKSTKINKDKIIVIPNGFDEADFDADNMHSSEHFVIAHTGTMSGDYDVEGTCIAFQNLYQLIGDKLKIKLAGKTGSTIAELIMKHGLSSVTEFIPYMPHNQIILLMQSADVLWLAIPNKPNNEGILTGKLFEYLGARKPILGVGPINGSANKVIDECEAGKLFDYQESKKIQFYLQHLYQNKLDGVESISNSSNYLKYSRKTQAGVLAGIIEKLNS